MKTGPAMRYAQRRPKNVTLLLMAPPSSRVVMYDSDGTKVSLLLELPSSNNEAEYEALVVVLVPIAKELEEFTLVNGEPYF